MKVKLNITPHELSEGDLINWVEVRITPQLKQQILKIHKILVTLDAECLLTFKRPDWRFGGADCEPYVSTPTLVVCKSGDCWWEGCYKNTGMRWKTGVLPLWMLLTPSLGIDLRERRDERKAKEEGGHG